MTLVAVTEVICGNFYIFLLKLGMTFQNPAELNADEAFSTDISEL